MHKCGGVGVYNSSLSEAFVEFFDSKFKIMVNSFNTMVRKSYPVLIKNEWFRLNQIQIVKAVIEFPKGY